MQAKADFIILSQVIRGENVAVLEGSRNGYASGLVHC